MIITKRHARITLLISAALLILAATTLALTFLPTTQAAPPTQSDGSKPTPTPTTTPTGTPRPTVSLGTNTHYIAPNLWVMLQRHADRESGLPNNLQVRFVSYVRDHDTRTESNSLSEAITAAGGTSAGGEWWVIPTGEVLSLVQRSDVREAYYQPQGAQTRAFTRLENAYGSINDILSAYTPPSNIVPEQAARYALFIRDDSVFVIAQAPNSATITSLEQWLTDDSRDVPVHDLTDRMLDDTELVALIPVEYLEDMANRFRNTSFTAFSVNELHLSMDRNEWHPDHVELEDSFTDQFTADGTLWSNDQSENSASSFKTDATTKLVHHGIKQWHDFADDNSAIKGSGVTVGIIDWSYTGISNLDPEVFTPSKTEDPSNTTSSHNMLCQPANHGVYPLAYLAYSLSRPCEATVGTYHAHIASVTHGVSIAELVKDAAPRATLLLAQANSPYQVNKAAEWLTAKGADVIVHAGGWPYDGPGDGASPLEESGTDVPSKPRRVWAWADSFAHWKYYPSPLNTVDKYTNQTNGPVWINAAGNQQEWTITVEDPELSSNALNFYNDFVLFQDSGTPWQRTCQTIPLIALNVYLNSLRWEDNTVSNEDVEFEIWYWSPAPGWLKLDESKDSDQIEGENFLHSGGVAIAPASACLRIKFDGVDDDEMPDWLQFQALVAPDALDTHIAFDNDDIRGRTVVNPAETSQTGLVAIGAEDIQTTAWDLMDYSSRGPVFMPGQDTTGTASHDKPDVVAGTGVATLANWLANCEEGVVDCDGKYFWGTSGATAQSGGMAALIHENLTHLGYAPKAADVANYMKTAAQSTHDRTADEGWGHGFMKLPCPSQKVGLLLSSTTKYGDWEASDCDSEEYISRKSDYYSFKIQSRSKVQVELDSPNYHGWVRFTEGPHHRRTNHKGVGYLNNNTSADSNSLPAGVHTVEVTTYHRNTSFSSSQDSYTLKLTLLPTTATTSVLSPGGSTTLTAGGSASLTLAFEDLTSGQSYRVDAVSNNNRIGFDQSCGNSTSEPFTPGSTTHQLSLVVYACSASNARSDDPDDIDTSGGPTPRSERAITTTSRTPISNISLSLYQTGIQDSLHTTYHQVSVAGAQGPNLPPAPSSVSAGSASRTSINVSWSAVARATKYRVQSRQGRSGEWVTKTSNAAGTSYRVRGLSCGRIYYFRVAAYGDGDTYDAAWGPYTSTPYSTSTNQCQLSPIFVPSSFSFGVPEDASAGDVVGTLTARDPDGSDSALRYSITSGNADGKFAIDAVTGVITLTGDITSDTPATSQLTARVQDSQGLTDSATVRIRVLKVIPMFSAMDYELHVVEGASVGQEVGTIVAMDPDAADNLLRYSITDGNSAGKFALDTTTGVITLARAIGEEDPTTYTLTMRVTDRDNRTDTATVVVLVVMPVEVELRQRFLTGAEDTEGNTVRIEVISWDRPGRNLVFPLVVEHERGASAADYSGIPETMFVPATEHIGFFDFTITDDTARDAGERIKVTLAELPVGVSVEHQFDDDTVVTIRDNDGHSDRVIWSTTLTVGDHGGYLGFSDPSLGQPGGGDPAGTLSSNQFTWNGTTYRVTDLLNNPYRHSGYLGLDLTSPLTTGDYGNLTLRFDGMALKVSDREYPDALNSRQWSWDFVATEWSVGEEVLVELTYRRP